jgi:hypothetical protein
MNQEMKMLQNRLKSAQAVLDAYDLGSASSGTRHIAIGTRQTLRTYTALSTLTTKTAATSSRSNWTST